MSMIIVFTEFSLTQANMDIDSSEAEQIQYVPITKTVSTVGNINEYAMQHLYLEPFANKVYHDVALISSNWRHK